MTLKLVINGFIVPYQWGFNVTKRHKLYESCSINSERVLKTVSFAWNKNKLQNYSKILLISDYFFKLLKASDKQTVYNIIF